MTDSFGSSHHRVFTWKIALRTVLWVWEFEPSLFESGVNFYIKCTRKLPGPTNEFERSLVFETGEFERPKFDCIYSWDELTDGLLKKQIHIKCVTNIIFCQIPYCLLWFGNNISVGLLLFSGCFDLFGRFIFLFDCQKCQNKMTTKYMCFTVNHRSWNANFWAFNYDYFLKTSV